tara:strand:- start:1832 stop:2110 length:279 start_codon:yes stop_codon:yes gene_type:complete
MTIEDVAERADAWSEAIKKIIKAISAAGIAIAAAISALLMWWPTNTPEPTNTGITQNSTYTPQCSQLYNTIEHTWTEQQWSVWEKLKLDLDC